MNEQRQTLIEKLANVVEPVTDAADTLGVSRQRVLQLIHNGSLEATKIGRGWFVSSTSLQDRLDAQRLSELQRLSTR